MGKSDSTSIFPLPISKRVLAEFAPSFDDCELAWFCCVVVSLNSLWAGELSYEGEMSEGQRSCLSEVVKEIIRFCKVEAFIPIQNWDELFSVRSIDYKGGEVKVAKWFSWDNVSPALPAEVGKVPLAEVCSLGCRDHVLNFDHYLKPRSSWVISSAPRVMVKDEDWGSICEGLVASGVCEYITEADVFHTPTCLLLNGMFGVEKGELKRRPRVSAFTG